MSPETFPDLLAREAERAPHVTVPPDTWRRGRRRRRLKVAGAAAAAAVLLSTGAALAPALLDRDPVQPATPPGTSDLGLPDHLSAPPDALSEQDADGSWIAEQVSTDLAVGTAAAAWVTPDGLPVVVDAETGEHHLLDLPDVVSSNRMVSNGFGDGWQPVVLSPDGTRIAYAYARHLIRQDVRTVDSGVRVVDLTTGDTAWTSRLRGGDGILVTSLSWSASGDWVGWQGAQLRTWTENSLSGVLPVAGVVGPAGSGPVIGVAGGGSVVATDRAQTYVIEPGRVRAATYCPEDNRAGRACVGPSYRWRYRGAFGLTSGAALSPDGSTVALSADGYDLVTLPLAGVLAGSPTPPIRFSPTIGGEGSPDDRPWTTTSLGWVDEDHVLVLRDPGDGSEQSLAIAPADSGTGPSVEVGTVDAEVGIPSIAIELVTLDRPTVDRPDPDWPGDGVPSPLLGFVLALGLGLLLVAGVVALLRRVTR